MFCVEILSQIKSNQFFWFTKCYTYKGLSLHANSNEFGYYEGVQTEEYCGIHLFYNLKELGGRSVVWKCLELHTKTNVYFWRNLMWMEQFRRQSIARWKMFTGSVLPTVTLNPRKHLQIKCSAILFVASCFGKNEWKPQSAFLKAWTLMSVYKWHNIIRCRQFVSCRIFAKSPCYSVCSINIEYFRWTRIYMTVICKLHMYLVCLVFTGK